MLLQSSPAVLERQASDAKANKTNDGGTAGRRVVHHHNHTKKKNVSTEQHFPHRRALVSGRRSQWDSIASMANTEQEMTKLDDIGKSVDTLISDAKASDTSLVKWQKLGEATITQTTSVEILTEANFQVEAQLSAIQRTIDNTKALKTLFYGKENKMAEFEGIVADSELVTTTIGQIQAVMKDITAVVEKSGKQIKQAKDEKDLIAFDNALAPSVKDMDLSGLDTLTTKQGEVEKAVADTSKNLDDVAKQLEPVLKKHDGTTPLAAEDVPVLEAGSKALADIWGGIASQFQTEVKPLNDGAGTVIANMKGATESFTPDLTEEKPAEGAAAPKEEEKEKGWFGKAADAIGGWR